MDIIDNIFETVEKAGKLVATTAVDTKDYVKLEYKCAVLRNAINKDLRELGLITYRESTGADIDGDEKQALITELGSLKQKLFSLKDEMAKYKKVCPECKKASAPGAQYCSKCGTKL